MRKTAVISTIISLIFLLCACFAVAQTIPNLSGMWKMNPSKSKSERAVPSGIAIKFEQKGTSFKETFYLTFGTNEQSAEYEYTADGKDAEIKDPKVPYTISAKWEGKTLIQSWKKQGKSQGFTRKFTLSDDGNSIVMIIENPGSDGSVAIDTLFLEKQ